MAEPVINSPFGKVSLRRSQHLSGGACFASGLMLDHTCNTMQHKMKPVEKKAASLSIRLKPSVRAMAETRARQEDRSISSYIERLIVADNNKRPPSDK